ncbi:YchJ family metal-binding protein [Jeongeupia wiesaeckerbachi]|uniref:YchJ family protein n=1 Tax=Jeongeupia wiesaeckerbachi TaxID=3051218 RepID=UPI003D8041E5
MSKLQKPTDVCPCGSGRSYVTCCGQYHAGQQTPNAEALMRSRYSAYVLGDEAYLLASWAPETRPASLDLADGAPIKWLRLEVAGHWPAGEKAEVAFTAFYKVGGKAERLSERSRFRRDPQLGWLYIDGDVDAEAG